MADKEIEVGSVSTLEAGNTYTFHVTGTPVEVALALHDYKDRHGLNLSDLAKAVSLSMASISRYLSLLELEEELLERISKGEMAASTGYVLARLPAEVRAELSSTEARITLKDAEMARRGQNLREMADLFQDIETITDGVRVEKVACDYCDGLVHREDAWTVSEGGKVIETYCSAKCTAHAWKETHDFYEREGWN